MGEPRVEAAPVTMGLPLSALLQGQGGRLAIEVALGIVRDVALLLESAHCSGRGHGALSPHAIWVSVSGEVWLEWHPSRAPVARNLPPEVRHGETPTTAADVYALSAVAYELLTGLSISRAWAKAPLVPLQDVASARQFNAFVPPEIDEIVSKGLSRDPFDRPPRVEALARAAEGTAHDGRWHAELAELASDPLLAHALRDISLTCERAAEAPPRPHLPLPGPGQPPRLVVAEPLPAPLQSANDDEERVSAMPMVKIMIASGLAAVLSLALCLGLSRLGSQSAAVAPAPVAVEVPLSAPPLVQVEPLPPEAVAERAPVKVKAERPRASKRGNVSHSKHKRRP